MENIINESNFYMYSIDNINDYDTVHYVFSEFGLNRLINYIHEYNYTTNNNIDEILNDISNQLEYYDDLPFRLSHYNEESTEENDKNNTTKWYLILNRNSLRYIDNDEYINYRGNIMFPFRFFLYVITNILFRHIGNNE